jgi:hypothetical protein
MQTSVAEPRAENQKLNCLLEPEPKLRIAATAPFFYQRLEELLYKKIMIAKDFFVNYHSFNPFWVQNASILVKKSKSKKVFVQVSQIYSEPELNKK